LWNENRCSTLDPAPLQRTETTVSKISEPTPDATSEALVRERLQRTIDILCEDAARVELWACALSGFAQPVPDYYDPREKYRLEPTPDQG
jgi:hypothetical protein